MMNKKSELITLAVAIGFLVLTLIAAVVSEEKANRDKLNEGTPFYIGDNSINLSYNLRSNLPSCDINSIKIDSSHLVILGNHSVAIKNKQFKISEKCP